LNWVEDVAQAGEKIQLFQVTHTIVLRDLPSKITTFILRQGNKLYILDAEALEYRVDCLQNLIEKVLAGERFQLYQELHTMTLWNLLSEIVAFILRNWNMVLGEPKLAENGLDCLLNFMEEVRVVHTRE